MNLTNTKSKDFQFKDRKMLKDMLEYACEAGSLSEDEMIKKARMQYVMRRHKAAISHMVNASGYKHNKWKTYVDLDGRKKEVIRNSEEELFDALFDFYYLQSQRSKPFSTVFEELMKYKEECLGRSPNTICNDRRMFSYIDEAISKTMIDEITDERLQRWVISSFLKLHPNESALRKQFQLMNKIFEYGIRKKYCSDNPMKYMDVHDYLHSCNLTVKRNEEKEFSPDELNILRSYAMDHLDNPRTVMMLLAMETGMRVGELAALHKEDISDHYIHVHRQQRENQETRGHVDISELPYTKDERLHPHNGRFVPITDACRTVLEYAKQLPDDSEYLFSEKGKMITKSSYSRYLVRICRKLGTLPTNNHAFRIAFNSRMIDLGLSAVDRALILGHEVKTNENHYSLTDNRRLENIRRTLTSDRDMSTLSS